MAESRYTQTVADVKATLLAQGRTGRDKRSLPRRALMQEPAPKQEPTAETMTAMTNQDQGQRGPAAGERNLAQTRGQESRVTGEAGATPSPALQEAREDADAPLTVEERPVKPKR